MDNRQSNQRLKVLLVSCDWRNIFENDHNELIEKLERDRLNPGLNDFFIFSWSTKSYFAKKSNIQTLHVSTWLKWFKPAFELMTPFYLLYALRKYDFKPDVLVTYDLGFIQGLFFVKKIYKVKDLIMCINNQPRLYSATRKFGWIKSLYSRLLEMANYRYVDRYFTINDSMQKYLIALGVKKEKIFLFSMDTINRDQKYIKNSRRGIIRAKYNIPENKKILICVARLEAEKGHRRLLDYFQSLSDEYYLIILGQGSFEHDLRQYVNNLGLNKRVIFTGFVQRDSIWNYYKDADIFILLSRVEALGVVFWEAMYSGIPAVGSDVDGIVENLGSNGERGMIVRDNDNNQQFSKIIKFCSDPSPERDNMLSRAKAYVDEKINNKLSLNDIV